MTKITNKLQDNPFDDYDTDDLVKTLQELELERKDSDEFKENNLEYDLITAEWLVQKAKGSKAYAQNIYAALCNNDFQKLDVMQILSDKTWSCSWRYAGGIIADIVGQGDYLDWYCTGLAHNSSFDYSEDRWEYEKHGFVPEGQVTNEVRDDFLRLGWRVVDNDR